MEGFLDSCLTGPLLILQSPEHRFSIFVYFAFNLELTLNSNSKQGMEGGTNPPQARVDLVEATSKSRSGRGSDQKHYHWKLMQVWLKRLPVEDRMHKQRGGFATSTDKGITTKNLI